MPEDARPPVAVRIARPQATEDEFLEQELDTLSRTGVTLLGAQQRPQGVVIRFELVLASGTSVLRGEGRVVGFKPNAHAGLDGLTLRFTRLDSRSKALIDKAAAMRDRRRPSFVPPQGEGPASTRPPSQSRSPSPPAFAPPPRPPVTPEPAPSAPPPPPRARRSSGPPPLPAWARREHLGMRETDGNEETARVQPEPKAPAASRSTASRVASPAPSPLPPPPSGDRDALLDRLRSRAKALDPTAVQKILEQRRRA